MHVHQRLLGSSPGAHSWGGVGGVFMGRELHAGAFHDLWGLRKGHIHGEVWEACLWGVSCTLRPPATGGVAKRHFVRFWIFDLGYVRNENVYSLAQSLVAMCCDQARQALIRHIQFVFICF